MQKVKMEQIAEIWSAGTMRKGNFRHCGFINCRSRIDINNSLSEEIKKSIKQRCLENKSELTE